MNRLLCSFDPGACESQERDAKNRVTSTAEARSIYGKWLGLTQLTKLFASVRRSLCRHLITRVTSHCDRALSLGRVVCVFVNGFAVHHIEQTFF